MRITEGKNKIKKNCFLISYCFPGILLRRAQQNCRFLIKSCILAAQSSTKLPLSLKSARKDLCYVSKRYIAQRTYKEHIQESFYCRYSAIMVLWQVSCNTSCPNTLAWVYLTQLHIQRLLKVHIFPHATKIQPI